MTSKERVHADLDGKPVDRCPVTASYNQLYFQDHVAEITGGPWWEVHRWYAASVARHMAAAAAAWPSAQHPCARLPAEEASATMYGRPRRSQVGGPR